METLPIHFRIIRDDLIAVFPSLWDGAYLTCYALVGQHLALDGANN